MDPSSCNYLNFLKRARSYCFSRHNHDNSMSLSPIIDEARHMHLYIVWKTDLAVPAFCYSVLHLKDIIEKTTCFCHGQSQGSWRQRNVGKTICYINDRDAGNVYLLEMPTHLAIFALKFRKRRIGLAQHFWKGEAFACDGDLL